MRHELDLVYSFSAGPWRELARPGDEVTPTGPAVAWVLANSNVSSTLVAVASVAELEVREINLPEDLDSPSKVAPDTPQT